MYSKAHGAQSEEVDLPHALNFPVPASNFSPSQPSLSSLWRVGELAPDLSKKHIIVTSPSTSYRKLLCTPNSHSNCFDIRST